MMHKKKFASKHRKSRIAIVVLMAITGIICYKAGARNSFPAFEDYYVPALEILNIGNIPPAVVSFDDKKTRQLCSPYLLPDTMYDPNFCGHYFIQAIPCGTMCEKLALLDCSTGKVTVPDLPTAEFQFECTEFSNLLVINPPVRVYSLYGEVKDLLKASKTWYYVFKNGKFTLKAKRKYGRLL